MKTKRGRFASSLRIGDAEERIAMIARLWHGVVPLEKAEQYLKLMRTVAIPDYQRIPGNKRAIVLQRNEGDVAHFMTFTLWDSIESIRAFAGEDINRAKYYDFDASYLAELEPTVHHFEAYDS
jgi:heme-degrading monooxygenase HmoA